MKAEQRTMVKEAAGHWKDNRQTSRLGNRSNSRNHHSSIRACHSNLSHMVCIRSITILKWACRLDLYRVIPNT